MKMEDKVNIPAGEQLGKFLYRVLCGFLLGLSVFAPGFSGSIIAIIMGVYQDILRILANPFKDFKRNFFFCLPLGIGVVISAVAFLVVFRYLFDTYEKATYLLFVGLIVGNLPAIYAEGKKAGFVARDIIALLVALVAAFLLGISAGSVVHEATAQTLNLSLVSMVVGGLLTGAIALVPGMSISMVLILLGVYKDLLFTAESIMRGDLTNILPFGIFAVCAVAALVLTSRLIKVTFEKLPGLANAAVLGFMVGSLAGILVTSLRIPDASFTWLQGAIMLLVGLAISMLFVVLSRRMNDES